MEAVEFEESYYSSMQTVWVILRGLENGIGGFQDFFVVLYRGASEKGGKCRGGVGGHGGRLGMKGSMCNVFLCLACSSEVSDILSPCDSDGSGVVEFRERRVMCF